MGYNDDELMEERSFKRTGDFDNDLDESNEIPEEADDSRFKEEELE